MKKKILMRIATAALTLAMTAGLIACGNNAEQGTGITSAKQNASEEPLQTDRYDPTVDLPNITYGGETFTFLTRDTKDGNEYFFDLAVQEVSSASPSVDKAVYSRNLTVQDRFQVEFAFVPVSYADFPATVDIAIKSDPDMYDVIVGHGRRIFEGVTAGKYADWNELEHIDLSGDWWSQRARAEWTTPGGKLFAMNGDISYLSIGDNCAMFFNKTILANAGITSPYDQVYANNWTLETFIQTAKQADGNLNHSDTSKITTDSFGYATECWRGPIYVTFCAGIGSLVKQEDGSYEIGLKNELIGNTVATYLDFVKDSGVAYFGNELNDIRNAFLDSRAVFLDDNVKCAVFFKGSELDFGIVPFPKADPSVEYSGLVGAGSNVFAVLKNRSAEQLSRASLILEAMACYGYMDVIPHYYDTILSYQAMRDEHSLEMLGIIRNAGFFDLGHYTNYGRVADLVKLMLEQPGTYGTSIQTAVARVENETMSRLERNWYLLDSMD